MPGTLETGCRAFFATQFQAQALIHFRDKASKRAVFDSKEMKTKTCSLFFVALLSLSSLAYSEPTKTYQVTGPVLEMNDSMIAVQKGKDRWEIARDATTKADSGLKVGDKVTITYTMTATKVQLKADKQARAEDKKAAMNPSPSPKE